MNAELLPKPLRQRYEAATIGRPSKYRGDYHPNTLLFYAVQGLSMTQIASEFGVCRSTLYEWAKTHEEFSDAFKTGHTLSQAYYEDIANQNVLNSSTSMPQFLSLESILAKRYGLKNTEAYSGGDLSSMQKMTPENKVHHLWAKYSDGKISAEQLNSLLQSIRAEADINLLPGMLAKIEELKANN